MTNGDSLDAINHCHEEENEKNPTYVLANAAPSPPPSFLIHTLFPRGQPLFNFPSVEMYEEQTASNYDVFFFLFPHLFTGISSWFIKARLKRAAHPHSCRPQSVSRSIEDGANASLAPGGTAEEKGCTMQVADGALYSVFWRQRTGVPYCSADHRDT